MKHLKGFEQFLNEKTENVSPDEEVNDWKQAREKILAAMKTYGDDEEANKDIDKTVNTLLDKMKELRSASASEKKEKEEAPKEEAPKEESPAE